MSSEFDKTEKNYGVGVNFAVQKPEGKKTGFLVFTDHKFEFTIFFG